MLSAALPRTAAPKNLRFELLGSRVGTTSMMAGRIEVNTALIEEASMNRDQVKGRANEVAGKAKKTTGRVIGNRKMEAKGAMKEAGGKIRKTVGDVREQSRETPREEDIE
jgi:uncharacterized protein YjbJ (UPF0337 family)